MDNEERCVVLVCDAHDPTAIVCENGKPYRLQTLEVTTDPDKDGTNKVILYVPSDHVPADDVLVIRKSQIHWRQYSVWERVTGEC